MKEVIILGLGPSKDECPYDAEVWAVNDAFSFAKRVDKLFMTDGWQEFDIKELNEAKRKLGCEIVSATEHAGLGVTLYPIEHVIARFRTQFFTNTVCYMIEYALLLGYLCLRFYGIDMLTHTSYVMEKGGVEYWMGVARGMGVEIINTKTSATGKTTTGKPYGEWGDRATKIRELVRGI